MDGPKTTLLDLTDEKKFKAFTFDYSFWSYDGFELQDNGFAVPINDKYADQKKVY